MKYFLIDQNYPLKRILKRKEMNELYCKYETTNHWETIKGNLRKFYYRHKNSIDQKKEFDEWVLVEEDENRFLVYLGEKGRYPLDEAWINKEFSPPRDIHVSISTNKNEINNANLEKSILILKNELEKHWNDLVSEKLTNEKIKSSINAEITNAERQKGENSSFPSSSSNENPTVSETNSSPANNKKTGLIISLIVIFGFILLTSLFAFIFMKRKKK